MTTKTYLKKAKAISPIIATIILIVITVVAGGFIYAYVSGMLHSGATSQQATIQSYTLIPGSGNNATLTVTIQNSGTVAIKNVTVSFSNASITAPSFAINAIEPGSTASTSTPITGIFLAGDTYTATFVVTYANGATQDITEGLVASTY